MRLSPDLTPDLTKLNLAVTGAFKISLLGGFVSFVIAIQDWPPKILNGLLAVVGVLFVGLGLSMMTQYIRSRRFQLLYLVVAGFLAGLIPFGCQKLFCYLWQEHHACNPTVISANSIAYWAFPTLVMWLSWIASFFPEKKNKKPSYWRDR